MKDDRSPREMGGVILRSAERLIMESGPEKPPQQMKYLTYASGDLALA